MEIIGRNIPQFQGAISTGLNSVAEGIAESVKATGVSALDDTFEIFSASNMGVAQDPTLLPAVANVAEFPDPITSLAAQSNGSSDANSLLQTLQNPKFAPEAELATLTEAKVNETFKNLGKELIVKAESDVSANGSELNGTGATPPSQAISGAGPSSNSLEERGIIIVGGKTPDGPDLPAPTDAGTPSSNTLEARGIIIVGGKTEGIDLQALAGAGTPSSNTLEARGIIIVGGKTDGTYFQTIDDSVNDLRNDPQPEALQLFRNQITAVQDMTSTSMEAVNLLRQFSVSQRGFVR